MMRAPLINRIALNVAVSAILAFLVVPILAVVPGAFNEATYLRLPPESYSLRWFAAFFADAGWRASFWTSFAIAFMATGLSVALGTLAALGIARTSGFLQRLLTGAFLAPMIVPVIVTAIALYFVSQRAGLIGTFLGLALGHTLLCLPFVVINVGIALRSIDRTWLLAAEGLGAGPFTAFRTVTFPNVLPGMLGGAVFAFITSFDEVVVSVFLAGVQAKTLPVKMWETIRLEFTPVVAVASTFMILLTVLPFVLARLRARSNEARDA